MGARDDALRLLSTGSYLIEQYCPSMLRSLAAMAVLSRMVAAIAPVRPLLPKDFHLAQLVQLAYLNQFLHHFLVSTGERFRLRAAILSRGFRVILAVVRRATFGIDAQPTVAAAEWDQLSSMRLDLHALTDESLETMRILLTSADAERKAS
jgi:hypothetical protein